VTPEPDSEAHLLAAGWRFAALTGGAEMTRMLEMYRELGIEVTAVPVDPATCDGCTTCFEGGGELYRVYTRPTD
jgi:hypothetical protein